MTTSCVIEIEMDLTVHNHPDKEVKFTQNEIQGANLIDDMNSVAQQVCQFLDVESLKIVRELNKIWRDAAAGPMLVKSFVRVPPGLYRMDEAEKKEEIAVFSRFLQKIRDKNEEKQPIVRNVKIVQFGDLEILQGLQILQDNVTDLGYCLDKKFESVLKDLLTNKLTNLQSFGIFRAPGLDPGPSSGPGSEIPTTASYYADTRSIRLFIELNKIYLIKKLFVSVDPGRQGSTLEKQVKILEKFAEGSPLLENIVIGKSCKYLQVHHPLIFTRIIQVLNKIMESSKDTLLVMEICDALSDLEGLQIPLFSHLTVISVLLPSEDRANIPIFPKGPKNFNLFPKVTKVMVGVLHRKGESPENSNSNNHHQNERFPVFKPPALSTLKILLPMLSPDMKFAHFDLEQNDGRVKHQFLVSYQNFVPAASIESMLSRVEEDPKYNGGLCGFAVNRRFLAVYAIAAGCFLVLAAILLWLILSDDEENGDDYDYEDE